MIRTTTKLIYGIFFLSVLFFSCKQVNEKHTASGMKYIVYKQNAGTKAKIRDFVTIDMVYKTENDSILFDSGKNKMPMRFQLTQPPFAGSMQEGLMYMAEGDSATFFVSADSMIRNVFSKLAGPQYVRPEFLKTGSFLKFDIKLVRLQSELDASEEIYHEMDKKIALEKSGIEKYVKDHGISQFPDSNGIYVIKKSEGKGAEIDMGQTVSINYSGQFLTGLDFDSNKKLGRPYSFVVGSGDVIKGWDFAFRKLRSGDKATLIIPSAFGYGEEGLRNKSDGTFIIPPYSPLLFEVEIVAVRR